ncbi:MAG: transglutaminase family protein, partial [Tabrizicola sp.]
AHTTAAEALALGEGVCQDHAHALVACARHRGLPARYVSGYLFATQDGTPHEAAHAWAELHIPGLGWVGFDPANRACPDARYIRLGSGFDAQDAAPIRGIARGGAREAMDVTVAVQQSAQ